MRFKILMGWGLMMATGFTLAGCQNNEAVLQKRQAESASIKKFNQYRYTPQEKKTLKYLMKYDQVNPYSKIEKVGDHYLKDGIKLPPHANQAMAYVKKQNQIVHDRTEKTLAKVLTKKQRQDRNLAIRYVTLYQLQSPVSPIQLQQKIDAKFKPGMFKAIAAPHPKGYEKLARFAAIQKFGLGKPLDPTKTTAYLQAQGFTLQQIKLAFKLLPMQK